MTHSTSTKFALVTGGTRGIGAGAALALATAGYDVLATGGGSALYGNPEQIGEALIGYRQELIPHLTLTSQLTMGGTYVFAPGDGIHTAMTPEMKLSVDLARLADLPWQTSFDVTLARKVPLVASDFETRGRAMLSLKYKWD